MGAGSTWIARGFALLFTLLAEAASGQDLRPLTVDRDDVLVDRDALLVIPAGLVIEDDEGDGVVRIVADGVTVRFAEGSVLRGASEDRPGDRHAGVGLSIDGVRGVRVLGARIRGFKVGISARDADGLVLRGAEIEDVFRQRLGSTPRAEDSGDWLAPHDNDRGEWAERYGAALRVRSSVDVEISGCRVRRAQNGILLEGVRRARVFDNDASFLSGWGLALWRSSDNLVSRNAFDFCVRGYSHGVYNRGQDSAGVLLFEQCSRNLFAENSCTHGGDGVFGFAGKEALGQRAPREDPSRHRRRGNDDNVFLGNDLSHAAAHGLEATFSFGNVVVGNRFADNAICGIWGGYSREFLVAGNRFEGNGGGAYGLERGGVNVEHGSGWRIVGNDFLDDACGVHLWWDEDPGLLATPWVLANGADVKDNLIAANLFRGGAVGVELRACPGGATLLDNRFEGPADSLRTTPGSEPLRAKGPGFAAPLIRERPVLGETRPVGARRRLRGRENIVMTPWGPWDHASPLLRLVEDGGRVRVYEVLGAPSSARVETEGAVEVEDRVVAGRRLLRLTAQEEGLVPFALRLEGAEAIRDRLLDVTWKLSFFRWSRDPREDLSGFRAAAAAPDLEAECRGALRLPFASGGPSQLEIAGRLLGGDLPSDGFGTLARARLRLPAGRHRLSTLSDDGLRVLVEGRPLIEDWTWHGPTRHEAFLDLPEARTVDLVVEHFELDGYAVLELLIL